MRKPKIPHNEAQRIEALRHYQILDTPSEQEFDDMVSIASLICDTPIALVSLVDQDRQWFKAKVGIDAEETHRDLAFCAHAIHEKNLFCIENAIEDERFHDNPLVTQAPNIRFYAGAPLITKDNYALGTLCVIDSKPHNLNAEQAKALSGLARQVVRQMELRLMNRELTLQNSDKVRLLSTLSHDLRSPFNGILGYSDILQKNADKMKPEKLKQFAEHISTSSRSAFDQLENLLSWCKSEMNAIPNTLSPLELEPIFSNVMCSLKIKAEAKQIQLCHDYQAPISMVEGNPDLLHSVILNLLTNAIKFSYEQGKVTLQVQEEEENTRISVIDYGVGLKDEQIEAIFSSNQIQSCLGTSGEKGSGVGLLLVKSHLARMNSRLSIAAGSEEQGTCFSFLLRKAGNH